MTSLRDALSNAPDRSGRSLWGAAASIALSDLGPGTSLRGHPGEFAGRSVLIRTRDPLAAALSLIELDGTARRLVICTPELSPQHLPAVMDKAGADVIVTDDDSDDPAATTGIRVPTRLICGTAITRATCVPVERYPTEWVLLTSGTSGAPKMVVHTLASLTAPIAGAQNRDTDVVWGTFYDIRRYGGLQILLRAILGKGSFVVSHPAESPRDYLLRLAAHGATHISGTASHWRRVLMSPEAAAINPRYVRLSGEIADQAILNSLRSFYPHAGVAHAFASTEAGVGFEVNDGLEGFPASLIGNSGQVEIKIADGSLRLRSARSALSYLGEADPAITDEEGFVDTGDMVEQRDGRYYFLGRRTGVINVGGLKVYPEEVEAVINRHPAVGASVVRSRRNPLIGSLVAADVVLRDDFGQNGPNGQTGEFEREIREICHEHLAAHKIPALIRFVHTVGIAAAGKLARRNA
jgi:acyl-CoA synthetase (AMP-forming)/AMP-acid ligase II